MLITFEGCEGSGKTTQIKRLYTRLQDTDMNVVLTREPGGTSISNQIRSILLDNLDNINMEARAEFLLFCASRAQLVSEIIFPHLANGSVVLCDRYTDSTLAYQGYGHDLPLDKLQQMLDFCTSGLSPELTIYLDVDPEIGLARRRKGQLLGESWNRLDAMKLAFHNRVHAGYSNIIAESPERFYSVNADMPIDEIANIVWRKYLNI